MRSILIMLSFLVVLSSGCNLIGKKKREEQAKARAEFVKDSTEKAQKAAKALALKKQQDEKARQDSIKRAEEERRKLYKYHIIVGSFKTPKYATAYNDFIGKKGYQTELITNEYKFQMVSIGAFKSWGDAVKELVKAREAIEPTSWIYIRE